MNRFHFRLWANYHKGRTVLRKEGFSAQEIDYLCQLRRVYKPGTQDQAPLPESHLLFIRWLVQQGKLNEGFIEAR